MSRNRNTLRKVVAVTALLGASVSVAGLAAPLAGASTHAKPNAPVNPVATITPTTLPGATVGVAYSATLTQTGATGTVLWIVREHEQLPRGLKLNPLTGELAGTPRAAGTSTFHVVVRGNGNKGTGTAQISLTVNGGPAPSATSAALPNGTVGTFYSTTVQVTGGTAPYHLNVLSGSLPKGIHLGEQSGTLSGTPREAGSFAFTVSITDHWHATAQASFTMVVVGGNAPAITTVALPVGTQGVPYTATLTAAGGTAPFTWVIRHGELPKGLSLDSSTGVISGTPAKAGIMKTVHVMVTDAKSVVGVIILSITIAPAAAPVINQTQLPSGVVGTAYSTKLTASGGAGDYHWTIAAGALPAGLTLNHDTGVISGIPTSAVIAAFTVSIHDHHNVLAIQAETLTVLTA